MARRGDTRSPSPAGSYSSSRRSRKDEDRGARDKRDDRGYRARSPVNSDRRHRDGDRDSYRRGPRSPDRRDSRREDDYRLSKRDRSRDRRRSPDRDDRSRRYRDDRDKGRDYRDRRPDSRDRRRRDREEPESKSRRNEAVPVRSSAPAQLSEEEKKAERLAKLEAWKQKQAAEKERKLKEAGGASITRELLKELDKKESGIPAVASLPLPSPATPTSIPSSAPYAGKFDPKVIAKKAAAAIENMSALGEDLKLPSSVKESAKFVSSAPGLQADTAKARNNVLPPASKPSALKAKGNLSGFGLGNKQLGDSIRIPAKRGLELDDEQSTRKKLEKLPTPPPEETMTTDDTALANDAGQDDEDDEVMAEAGTEEEAAAAARAAAEKREERLLTQADDTVMEEAGPVEDDTAMTDAPIEDEEDVDPLDAFMDGLDTSKSVKRLGGGGSIKKQEPATILGDDEDEFSTINANPDDILEMASKARKKKEIPAVNHAKMNYDTFRKDFYMEPTELADLTEEEVADLRLELEGIKVRGVDVPKPVQKWSQLGLGVSSLDVIQKLGYERPTSIQSQAIPAIMSGRDLIGIAKTGSGKTMGFLLPMWRHIKGQRPLDSVDGPIGLILTPTRELATQIHKECRPWLKALDLRAVCAYGGAPIKDQIADLKRGAEVVVCTPGRMIDLLAANSGRVTNLRRVTYIVLDEADRMFDMGFEPQVMKILANVRPDRQTVLFSATFPRNMEALARKTLIKPIEVMVGGRSVVAPEIKQLVEVRAEDAKFVRLLQLLGDIHEDEDARSLIFVNRQEAAEELMNAILRRGYPCFTIHGGKDQYDRDSVISDFKAGVFPVLVATSVAARGLDVKQLKLVVNYDVPSHLEDYVHRSGRTGRAGQTGLAVTFITPEQARFSGDIAKALKQSGQEVPEEVRKLVDDFQEQVKAGKEKAAAGGGFGGKGLERLDQERDATRTRERKIYKTGDEPEEEEKEKEDKDEEAIIVKPAGSSSATTTAAAPSAPIPGVPAGIDLDGAIKVHKTEPATPANPADRMKGVSDAVAAINARLRKTGDIRGNAPIDNKGPDAGAFHATLEINDFPQKARWAVTNRTNVAKILDSTGTSITTKGNFYAAGATPGPTDAPKLYILVEGDTELVVTNAMRELMRLLKDGTTAAMDSEARAPASGRYNVL